MCVICYISTQVNIVNLFYRLIVDQSQHSQQLQQLREELNSLGSRHARLQQRLDNEHQAHEDTQKQYYALDMRRRTETASAVAVEKKLKERLKQLQKNNLVLSRRDNQYKHDLRKNERSYKTIQVVILSLSLSRSLLMI